MLPTLICSTHRRPCEGSIKSRGVESRPRALPVIDISDLRDADAANRTRRARLAHAARYWIGQPSPKNLGTVSTGGHPGSA
jgi:hypothetical protein